MKQFKQSPATRRRSPVLASLALACAMFAGNAHAGIPVVDGGHISAQLAKFVQDFGKWAKDFAHYKAQVDHMTQELIALGNILDTATMGLQGNPLDNIQKRPLNAGMERCDQGGGGGFSLTDLLGGLLDISGDNYVQKQKDICQKIVTLENYKYNDLVEALKDLQKLKTNGLDKTTSLAQGSGKNGEMQATTQSTTQLVGELQLVAARVETTMMVYDGMIQSLNNDMRNVAQEAMDGKKKNIVEDILSTAITTGTMKLALEAQESDCPDGFECD